MPRAMPLTIPSAVAHSSLTSLRVGALPIRGRPPRADDGNRRVLENLDISLYAENIRTLVDFSQERRISFIPIDDHPVSRLPVPLISLCDEIFRQRLFDRSCFVLRDPKERKSLIDSWDTSGNCLC